MGLKSVITVPVIFASNWIRLDINAIHDVSRILLMSLSQFDATMREESCYKRVTIFALLEFIVKFFPPQYLYLQYFRSNRKFIVFVDEREHERTLFLKKNVVHFHKNYYNAKKDT